jgi:hypothetical protein
MNSANKKPTRAPSDVGAAIPPIIRGTDSASNAQTVPAKIKEIDKIFMEWEWGQSSLLTQGSLAKIEL